MPPVKLACARGSGDQIGAGSERLAEEGRPSPGPSPKKTDPADSQNSAPLRKDLDSEKYLVIFLV